jgi:hypothetical protein
MPAQAMDGRFQTQTSMPNALRSLFEQIRGTIGQQLEGLNKTRQAGYGACNNIISIGIGSRGHDSWQERNTCIYTVKTGKQREVWVNENR